MIEKQALDVLAESLYNKPSGARLKRFETSPAPGSGPGSSRFWRWFELTEVQKSRVREQLSEFLEEIGIGLYRK